MRTFSFQHRYMWHTVGSADVRINETGAWNEIPGLALSIVLPEPASIRVLYSISVMPDQSFGSHGKIMYVHLTSPWTAGYCLVSK